jgi:hypothetical protein
VPQSTPTRARQTRKAPRNTTVVLLHLLRVGFDAAVEAMIQEVLEGEHSTRRAPHAMR